MSVESIFVKITPSMLTLTKEKFSKTDIRSYQSMEDNKLSKKTMWKLNQKVFTSSIYLNLY